MDATLLRGSAGTHTVTRIRLSVILSMLFVCSCSVAPSDDRQPCSEQWFSKVEEKLGTQDSQGHGPDIGSSEWRSVVEFKLGVRGNLDVPPRETVQWCVYIDEKIRAPVYSIEGRPVSLESGSFTGSDGTISLLTSTSGDLDGDTAADQAAILVHSSRGTGTFYYLNVLLTDHPKSPARVVFLGDRIRFDYIDIYEEGSVSRLTGVPIHRDDYGKLVVGYYTHGPDQAFAEIPEIYVTRHWKVAGGKLVAVEDY